MTAAMVSISQPQPIATEYEGRIEHLGDGWITEYRIQHPAYMHGMHLFVRRYRVVAGTQEVQSLGENHRGNGQPTYVWEPLLEGYVAMASKLFAGSDITRVIAWLHDHFTTATTTTTGGAT